MRRSTSGGGSVPTTTSPVQLVPFSPTRVALILSANSTNATLFSFRNSDNSMGYLVGNVNAGPIILNLGDHGNLVYGPFWAATTTGTGTAAYIESHLPDPLPGGE